MGIEGVIEAVERVAASYFEHRMATPHAHKPRVVEGVAQVFGIRALFVTLWAWLRFPLALALLWVVPSVAYLHSPAITLPWRSVMPGAGGSRGFDEKADRAKRRVLEGQEAHW